MGEVSRDTGKKLTRTTEERMEELRREVTQIKLEHQTPKAKGTTETEFHKVSKPITMESLFKSPQLNRDPPEVKVEEPGVSSTG